MEYVFEKIIAIEHRAQEVYEEAVTQSKQMKEAAHNDILARANVIREMSTGKINQLVKTGQKDVEERLERINRQIQQRLLQLEAEAQENAKSWEDLIFSRIIGD